MTTTEEEKRPVTRDVELPNQKPTEEAEPAPMLALTPPEAAAIRVANDPRERRRLAKLAAEQAKEAHIAANTTVAPVETTESKEEVQETVTTPVAEEMAAVTPEQQPLELDNTDAAPAEVVSAETAEQPAIIEAEPVVEVVTEVAETVQTVENNEQPTSPTDAEAEDEAAKAEKEKSNCPPRRPRGRPPKKSTPGNE